MLAPFLDVPRLAGVHTQRPASNRVEQQKKNDMRDDQGKTASRQDGTFLFQSDYLILFVQSCDSVGYVGIG